jgi:riboflavin kinase/FMN adenylyltransferase
MQIFRSLADIPASFGPSVVTIGNFDGVHRGHQAVIADVIARARRLNARAVAVTFDPHPVRILRPQVQFGLITPLAQKLELLALTGLDAVLVLPFDRALSQWKAREFAARVLQQALGAIEVQEGENFRFGSGAEAGVDDLAALGREFGFTARVHQPALLGAAHISSSAARAAIAAGDVGRARHLLGRPLTIQSTPQRGRGYGARYTVPTINLAPYPELLPASGVYLTCLQLAGERFASVTNVGNRPTLANPSFAVETHILDFHPIALEDSTPLELTFLFRLREEKQWPSPEALRDQIVRDVARARRYFARVRRISEKSKDSGLR